jgi:hypothetical protein
MLHPYKWIRNLQVGDAKGSASGPTPYDWRVQYPFNVELSSSEAQPGAQEHPTHWFGFVVRDSRGSNHHVPRVQAAVYEKVDEILEETSEPRALELELLPTDVWRISTYDEKKIAELSNWTRLGKNLMTHGN